MQENQKTFLLCPIPEHIKHNSREVTRLIRSQPRDRSVPARALQTIHEITDASLNYYFVRPMDMMKLGTFSRGLVKMGVSAGLGVLNTFGKKLLTSLSPEQLIVMADVIDNIVVELDHNSIVREKAAR